MVRMPSALTADAVLLWEDLPVCGWMMGWSFIPRKWCIMGKERKWIMSKQAMTAPYIMWMADHLKYNIRHCSMIRPVMTQVLIKTSMRFVS